MSSWFRILFITALSLFGAHALAENVAAPILKEIQQAGKNERPGGNGDIGRITPPEKPTKEKQATAQCQKR